jgi:hypothetical protein
MCRKSRVLDRRTGILRRARPFRLFREVMADVEPPEDLAAHCDTAVRHVVEIIGQAPIPVGEEVIPVEIPVPGNWSQAGRAVPEAAKDDAGVEMGHRRFSPMRSAARGGPVFGMSNVD